MLKQLLCCVTIGIGTGLCGQSLELDQPIYGHGPFHATDQSAWSLFRNMAGLSSVNEPALALGYQVPFNQTELQSLVLGIMFPSRPCLGISYYRSGNRDLLNQQLALNAAISSHGLDFGLRIKYWSFNIFGLSPINSISFDGGIQFKLTDRLLAGIFISNLTQSKLEQLEVLPITWFTGIKFEASTRLSTLIEFGQELGAWWQFSVGMEYLVKEKLFTRTGFNLSARRGYFGLGFEFKQFKADYAIDLHPYLGITQQAGLSVGWP